MTQENETALDDRQINIASQALADAVVALAVRGEVEGIEVAATSISKALVAGLGALKAPCNTR